MVPTLWGSGLMKFAGVVGDDGKLKLHEDAQFRSALAKWRGKPVMLDIETVGNRRSLQANRRYWGVTVKIVAEILSALSKGPLPIHPDQAHDLLCRTFLGEVDTPAGKVRKTTHDLSTAEFAEFVQKVEAHFTAEYGVVFDFGGEGF